MVDWISLIIGVIGAITGIVSLGWHVYNSKSRLKHDRTSFTLEKLKDYDGDVCRLNVESRLRNIGSKDTTIEDYWVTIDHKVHNIKEIEGTKIEKHSSRLIKFIIDIPKKEFEETFTGSKKIEVFIAHTFGKIRKKGETAFRTQWLTIA